MVPATGATAFGMNLHLKTVQTRVLGETGETNNVTFF